MADKPPKSDEDRALEGAAARKERERRNAPADGVPVLSHDRADLTPVGVVLELIDRSEIDDATKRKLKEHTANAHLRVAQLDSRTDVNRIADELDELRDSIVDIAGKHGTNGKLGALKARVDATEARRWALIMALVGSLLTIGGLAIAGGRWVGRIETDVSSLKQRLEIKP